MNFKSLQPILVTVVVGLIGAFTPQVTAWVSAHPDTAVTLGTIIAAVLHALQSPVNTTTTTS